MSIGDDVLGHCRAGLVPAILRDIWEGVSVQETLQLLSAGLRH